MDVSTGCRYRVHSGSATANCFQPPGAATVDIHEENDSDHGEDPG